MFKINLMYFILAFFSGIILSYINMPQSKVIYQYPDINDEKTIYSDKKNHQFKLVSYEVICP